MSFVRSLQLHAFRNYRDAVLGGMEDGFVVLTGANGAGKTNILEAISLLSPGRGLRNAKIPELRNRAAPEGAPWSVNAQVDTPVGDVKIGTGSRPGAGTGVDKGAAHRTDRRTERRIVRVNGVDLKAQADLSDYLSCVWLTPQMDGLFLGASSDRRRFFDRLVYAFDPAHAGRVTRYESLLSQRAKLLRAQRDDGVSADPSWLSSLEAGMAETGVAIAAARLQTLQSLSAHLETALSDTGFPVSVLALSGGIEDALQTKPALAVEDTMRERLSHCRALDAETGGAAVGPHRTDLQVFFAEKNMPAASCSTGEQKALLTGIVLAHAMRTHALRDAAPILLLDEIAAHLDAARRASLFAVLRDLRAQVFITGTDAAVFSDIGPARHLVVAGDTLKDAA